MPTTGAEEELRATGSPAAPPFSPKAAPPMSPLRSASLGSPLKPPAVTSPLRGKTAPMIMAQAPDSQYQQIRRALSLQLHMCHEDEPETEATLLPQPQGVTNLVACVLLFKAFIGTGLLLLPKAFAQGGLLFSVAMYVVLGFWCTGSILQLLACKRAVGGHGGYGEIAGRAYGPAFEVLVQTCVVLAQVCLVCTYLVFICQNVRALLWDYVGCTAWTAELSVAQLLGPLVVVYVPLILIRKVQYFAIPSLMGDAFILLSLVTICALVGEQFHSDPALRPPVTLVNTREFSLFVGTAVFAYEGIQLVIPIQEGMARPECLEGLILFIAVTCAVLFIGFGTFGYLTFGDDVADIVLLSLPKSAYVTTVQVACTGARRGAQLQGSRKGKRGPSVTPAPPYLLVIPHPHQEIVADAA